MKKLGFVCGEYLSIRAKSDNKIWVIDGDLADSDGAEEFIEDFSERFIAAGIAEQNMVSMAAGMAAENLHPWVFSFASFLCYRAYDQIRVCISQTDLPVVLVGSHAGGCSGRNGKTHTALNDISVMSSLPKINIWAPADEDDTKYAIDQIIKMKKPTYLRFPRDPQSPISGTAKDIRWIGDKSDIAIISYGASTNWAIEAQKTLAENDIKVGVLHFCKVWPLDKKLVLQLLEGVKIAFILEDHSLVGGLGTLLLSCKFNIELYNMGWPANWSGQSGNSEILRQSFGLSRDEVAKQIMKKIKKHS